MPGPEAAERPIKAPYRAQVFVCTDPWADGCESKGSREILTRFRREIRDRGLRLEVRASASFCLGGCRLGPNMVMHPDGVWYQGVSPDDVPELIDQHLLGGAAVRRLLRRDHHAAQGGALPTTRPSLGGVRGAFPRTVIDGLERTVTVPAQPQLAAAASPGAAALLAELLPAAQIVGVNAALLPTRVTSAILADHDVRDAHPGLVEAAEAAGVPLIALAEPRYIYSIQTNIGLAARVLGAEARAAELNAAIDAKVDANRAVAEAAGRRTRAVYYTPAGTTAGPYSFIATLIYGAGGENPVPACGEAEDDRLPLSIDELAALAPDVILLGGADGAPPAFRETLLTDPRLADTPAIRHGGVHWLHLAPYGDRLRAHHAMDAVADVHRLLYPVPE